MSSKHESDANHLKSIRSINKQWKETSIEFRINGRKMYFTMIFYNVFYNFTKAYTCLLGKWRNRWGVGGTITGHFVINHTRAFPPEEEIDTADNTNDLDISVTQSGLRRIATTKMGTQREYQYLDKPPIRPIHDCSPEIKVDLH